MGFGWWWALITDRWWCILLLDDDNDNDVAFCCWTMMLHFAAGRRWWWWWCCCCCCCCCGWCWWRWWRLFLDRRNIIIRVAMMMDDSWIMVVWHMVEGWLLGLPLLRSCWWGYTCQCVKSLLDVSSLFSNSIFTVSPSLQLSRPSNL